MVLLVIYVIYVNRTWYIPTQIYHGFRISTLVFCYIEELVIAFMCVIFCVFSALLSSVHIEHDPDSYIGRQNDSVWNWEIIVIIILVQIPYQPLHHNTETELSRAEKTQNITHVNTQWQFFDLAIDKSTDSEPMVYLCGYIPGSIRHIWCYILPRVTCVIPLVLDPHTHTQTW